MHSHASTLTWEMYMFMLTKTNSNKQYFKFNTFSNTHTRPHRKIPRQIIRRSQRHCSFPAQGLKSIDTNMGVNTLILWWTSKWCADVHHVHRKMHFEALPFAADCDSPVLCTLGLSFEGPGVGWTMMNQFGDVTALHVSMGQTWRQNSIK